MARMLYSSYRLARTKTKKKTFFSSRVFKIILPSFFVLGGFFYLLFLSPYFKIENVKISGTKTISEEELRILVGNFLSEKKLFFIGIDNIFLIPAKRIESSILAGYPKIEEVSLKKRLPKSFEINIKEREPAAIWCNASQGFSDCFFMDASGIAFEKAPLSEGSLVLKISEKNQKPSINAGERVLGADFANNLFNNKKILNEVFGMDFMEWTILDGNIVETKSSEGWKIILDLSAEVNSQFLAIKKVLSEIIPEKRSQLEYFDLRVKGRLYYK